MSGLGFNISVPQRWNKLWMLMWFVCFVLLILLAFLVPFWPNWLLYSIPLFWIPELIGIASQRDAFPPLTHTIRHFLPNWIAFPLLYFLVGTIGAAWLSFQRPLHLGGLFALLGWLTDHFAATYARPDPFPRYDGRTMTPDELPAQLDPPSRAF